MSLQFINNTDANTCSTDAFLDSLISLEYVDESSPRPPPSPVFRAPSEPNPYFVFYHPYFFIGGPVMYMRRFPYLSETRRDEYYQFSKNYYKNKNKYFRKQRKIHQPGGSSCDQRR